MPIREGAPLGAPTWIDLSTSDIDRARQFYGTVFGWTFESAGPEYGGYVNAFKDGKPVAGLMYNDPQWNSPDGWSTYLHTADIKATVAAAIAAGGVSCVEPMEVKDKGCRRRRARGLPAVSHVFLGLTIATIVGSPDRAWLGQVVGWRSAFVLVVVAGLITLAALWFWMPTLDRMNATSPLTELGALRRPQVWLALLTGMVGFGGMFAAYTYISTTLTDVAGLPRALVPLALMIFGVGCSSGTSQGAG